MSFNSRSNVYENIGSSDFSGISNPMIWLRSKVIEKTTKSSKIPLFYKEALRFLISKMGTLSYLNAEGNLVDIKCIHANPERAIAKLTQENNIILPIISVNQSSTNNADKRRRGAPQIITKTFWSEEKKRSFRIISEAPRAVDIQYSINVWAKYRADLDQIVEQIRLLFNPHLLVKNSYTDVAHAFIEQEVDQSTLELNDRQERVLRRSFNINLESYIPNPQFLITSTGEIEEFNVDTYLN